QAWTDGRSGRPAPAHFPRLGIPHTRGPPRDGLVEIGLRAAARVPRRGRTAGRAGASSPRAYTLFDPALGFRAPVTEEMARRVAPSAMMFYRALPGARQTAGDLFRFSLSVVRGELRTILIMGAISGLLGLVAPTVMGVVIDD